LTLEYLENAFYTEGLKKYSEASFTEAGFPTFVRGRISQIAEHEATHIKLLKKALGIAATMPCTYSFPDHDPKSFVALASALETGGVSAYLGSGPLLSTPELRKTAGSIQSTEARQASWIDSSALHGTPWSGSFDVPLDQNQIISIVHGFIVSCPATNPPLSAKPFPPLKVSAGVPGQNVTVTFEDNNSEGPFFLALLSGLSSTIVPIDCNNEATLPKGLQGVVFALVTTSSHRVSDNTTVAGVVPLNFDFSASIPNP